MSLEQDLAKLAELFAGRQAQLAGQLADAPASPVRDELTAAVDSLESQIRTVLAGVKEAVLRHEKDAQAATEKIEAAKKRIEAASKAHQAAERAKLAKPPAPDAKPSANGDSLHARLRGLLLDEFAPRKSAPVALQDPASIGNDLPAFDDSQLEAAALLDLGSLALLPHVKAEKIASRMKLSKQASIFLKSNPTLHDFVANLFQARSFPDLIDVLGDALPHREAVWWACLCARHSEGAIEGTRQRNALRAAVAWVLDPTATMREKALAQEESRDSESACGQLALAAGQLPAALALDQPKQLSASHHVQIALRLAGTRPEHQRTFAELGLGVASGEYTWKKLVSPRGSRAAPAPLPALQQDPGKPDGHTLGKLLLVELDLVRHKDSVVRDSLTDEGDFRWESSNEWNSLGR